MEALYKSISAGRGNVVPRLAEAKTRTSSTKWCIINTLQLRQPRQCRRTRRHGRSFWDGRRRCRPTTTILKLHSDRRIRLRWPVANRRRGCPKVRCNRRLFGRSIASRRIWAKAERGCRCGRRCWGRNLRGRESRRLFDGVLGECGRECSKIYVVPVRSAGVLVSSKESSWSVDPCSINNSSKFPIVEVLIALYILMYSNRLILRMIFQHTSMTVSYHRRSTWSF